MQGKTNNSVKVLSCSEINFIVGACVCSCYFWYRSTFLKEERLGVVKDIVQCKIKSDGVRLQQGPDYLWKVKNPPWSSVQVKKVCKCI